MKETAEFYQFQLEIYALAFKELYGEAPAKGVLYFSELEKQVEFKYQSDKIFPSIKEKIHSCWPTGN